MSQKITAEIVSQLVYKNPDAKEPHPTLSKADAMIERFKKIDEQTKNRTKEDSQSPPPPTFFF